MANNEGKFEEQNFPSQLDKMEETSTKNSQISLEDAPLHLRLSQVCFFT